MPSQLPRPLTRVPSYLLLKRCSELLHTPVENICLTSVAAFDMLGTVIMPNLYDGRRDFRITAEQYYDPQAKIEFPRPTPPDLSQPEIDELFTSNAAEREHMRRVKRWNFVKAFILGAVLTAIVFGGIKFYLWLNGIR